MSRVYSPPPRLDRSRERYKNVDVRDYLLNNSAASKMEKSTNAVIRGRRHEVGKSNLYPMDVLVGAATTWDQYNAAQIMYHWEELPPRRRLDFGPDFIKMNKKSQGKVTNARNVSKFRKLNNFRLGPKSTSSVSQRSETPSLQEKTHGRKSRVEAETVRDLMQNKFELDWVREQAYRLERQAKRAERGQMQRRLRSCTPTLGLPRGLGSPDATLNATLDYPTQSAIDEGPRTPREDPPKARPKSAHAQISAFARKFRRQVAAQRGETPDVPEGKAARDKAADVVRAQMRAEGAGRQKVSLRNAWAQEPAPSDAAEKSPPRVRVCEESEPAWV
uniref:Uncharacterized protein n=1 Tax=Eutreptiella gymnastica TaxID=73025 RepID=A0A7S4GJB2_9EUGL|mmetsp:Transcript_60293/g.99790  ORF Transcript_60293/g.99790 Transcript_60293/m.99790 type:complete len:332 (+) Transcript_60293:86-1081(+)